MLDAFDTWNRMLAVAWSMTQTSMRMAETMGAANDVVAARTALIGSAIRSPLAGDHRELGRMVPEKVDAFSRVGSAGIAAWWAAHAVWAGEMRHFGALAMRGRAPTPVELVVLGDRMARVGLESLEAAARLGSATVTPVHRKATANARRLNRKARR